MELLIKLEESVFALTAALQSMRDENAQLREQIAGYQLMEEEKRNLENALHREQEVRNEVNERVERLLAKVEEQLTEENYN